MAKKQDVSTGAWARLKFLLHPISIGVYWTLLFTATTFLYYDQKDKEETESLLYSVISEIDQKSFDYRLRFRGPRAVSDQVAVLAFDDKSLEEIGRWPWPRQTTAQVFKNAVDAGAKVIATDIVFSEPESRPDEVLVQQLKSRTPISPELDQILSEELQRLDGDRIFGEILQQVSSHVVLGNFYSSEKTFRDYGPEKGYTALCERLAFDLSPAARMWEMEGLPLIVAEPNDLVMPAILNDYYLARLQELSPDERSRFCATDFLDPRQDPFAQNLIDQWPLIRENDPLIVHPSFSEWAQDIKSRYLLNRVKQVEGWTTNLPGIYHDGSFNGFFNTILEKDGTIRRTQLVVRNGNSYVPSIALKTYMMAMNYSAQVEVATTPSILGTKGAHALVFRNEDGEVAHQLPIEPTGSQLINYAGPQKMFPYIRASDLLDPNKKTVTVQQNVWDPSDESWTEKTFEADRFQFLKDKILVAGLTAIAVYDLRLTPFQENYPGVETHANVIDNLLRNDFLRQEPGEGIRMVFVIFALGLLLSLALSYLGAFQGLLFAGLVAFAIAWVDRHIFFMQGLVVASALPLIHVGASYMILTFYKYLTEERSKKELRQTFSKYVSPAIVEEILQDPKNLQLGGRKERVTVFFSDIRGFTTISEKLDPQALSELLNDYLTPMTDLVFTHRGTLDKYMGDAIMAFFGAPIHYEDHAKHAARCALKQLEKLKELQGHYSKRQLPHIDIGIGLNTGEVSVGNMGSESVRSYTVMGDAVNLASRLEAINKTYGTHIMISEFTYEDIKSDFTCREIDWVRVKGKLLPVKIYELLSEGPPLAKVDEMKKYFDDGYALYRERRFEQAASAFEKAAHINGEDQTSLIYLERSRVYAHTPPPENWDGVFVMHTK